MSASAVHAFIEKMKDDVFRAELVPALAQVKEGDWEAVSQLATQHGFQFSADELKAEMKNYSGFFKGAGQVPEEGWDRATLPEA